TEAGIKPLWDLKNLERVYLHQNPVARQFCPNNRDSLCFIGNR
ncbi:MAG: leucine-rich repeat domain-containing protein, partial [Cyanobacteria bacterium J149]